MPNHVISLCVVIWCDIPGHVFNCVVGEKCTRIPTQVVSSKLFWEAVKIPRSLKEFVLCWRLRNEWKMHKVSMMVIIGIKFQNNSSQTSVFILHSQKKTRSTICFCSECFLMHFLSRIMFIISSDNLHFETAKERNVRFFVVLLRSV